MELSLGGIQYLYKDGSQIEDPQHQILLDETIVSQACLLEEISIVALVKGNIGALTENIDKAPYKKLFNGSTNSFTTMQDGCWFCELSNLILRKMSRT